MLAILTTHPIQYQVPIWQELARRGNVPFEVWYLTDFGVEPSRDREFGHTFSWDIDTLAGYPCRLLSTVKGATPASFWKCRLNESLFKRMKASETTALWIQGWQVAAYWQAVHAKKAAGVEVWLRGESNGLAPQPLWKHGLKRAQLGWLFGNVDRFFYIGSGNRRLYQSFGVTDNQLYSAPYAVDNDRFKQQAATLRPQRSELRRKYGIPEDAFCVLFCGKFIAKKRPADVVLAAQQLIRNKLIPKVHLLFVGAGQLGHALRASCKVQFDAEVQVVHNCDRDAPNASFTGFLNQTEISQAYVSADCLVLPSDYGETWGLVVNEALASSMPCIVSDACGCAEELAGPERTFRMAHVSDLAAKLMTLATSTAMLVAPPSIDATVDSVIAAYRESARTTVRSHRLAHEHEYHH